MLGAGRRGLLQRILFSHRRPLCNTTAVTTTDPQPTTPVAGGGGSKNNAPAESTALELYRDLDNLDMKKAFKILFMDLPKKKTFGLDFHLVQLFFACLPSLAVYLVAQYARHDMKKMDAELEIKTKAKEEKAKEIEANEAKQKIESNPELLKVKERLEALEETVKEIVVETKKQQGDKKSRDPDANVDSPKPQLTKPEQATPTSNATPSSNTPAASAGSRQ